MAKNKGRVGSVSRRSQLFNIITSLWQKRDLGSGQFSDVKTSGGSFKGVRREKR